MTPEQLAERIAMATTPGRRFIAAIAGPPGSGKSTLAAALATHLADRTKRQVALLPMDGFHYDNAVLEPAGLLARKGAPETFDATGFAECLARIRIGSEDVATPLFDRAADLARAGAAIVGSDCGIVLVEGNYLLLDALPWSEAAASYDLTVFLDVPLAELRRRLIQRWRDHGLGEEAAIARAEGNDLRNARLVIEGSVDADVVASG